MSWSKPPRQFAAEVVEQHRVLCQKVALDIDARIVDATPVDTGHARWNWIAALDAPATQEREGVDPDGSATVAEAVRVIDGARNFPVIYLSNNVPYIGALNYGKPPGTPHSKKAPLMFVELAVQAVTSVLK